MQELTLTEQFLNTKRCLTDLRNFMQKFFELFNDNSKIKTCFSIIVKQLSFFRAKNFLQIGKTILTATCKIIQVSYSKIQI